MLSILIEKYSLRLHNTVLTLLVFVCACALLPIIDTLRRLVNGNNNNTSPKHVELIEEPKSLKPSPKHSPTASDHRKDKKLKSSMRKINGESTESPSNNSTESKGSESSTVNSVSPKSSSKLPKRRILPNYSTVVGMDHSKGFTCALFRLNRWSVVAIRYLTTVKPQTKAYQNKSAK